MQQSAIELSDLAIFFLSDPQQTLDVLLAQFSPLRIRQRANQYTFLVSKDGILRIIDYQIPKQEDLGEEIHVTVQGLLGFQPTSPTACLNITLTERISAQEHDTLKLLFGYLVASDLPFYALGSDISCTTYFVCGYNPETKARTIDQQAQRVLPNIL